MALESYDDPDALYLYRGGDVNENRPYFTGDVFSNVPIPGVQDAGHAAIIAHPCSFRRGAMLEPSVLVAAVHELDQNIGAKAWTRGHYNRMPFPRLVENEHVWAAEFDRIGRAEMRRLTRKGRVACLSEVGINLMQHRLTHHLTRVQVPTAQFHEAFSRYLEEADLLEEWIDELAASGTARAEAEASFEEFIRSGDPSRQSELGDPQRRSAIRAQCRREASRLAAAVLN